MGPKSGAFLRYRPRLVTVIVLFIVVVPTVLANLCHDEGSEEEWPPPNPSYGWPLIWYWCEFKPSSPLPASGAPDYMTPELVDYSVPRLAGNLAMWFIMLAVAGVACEWLRRRYCARLPDRLRIVTLIVLLVVAAPIVLANLSQDEGSLSFWSPRNPSYGWPLIWRWHNQKKWYGALTELDWNYSATRLTCNLAMWIVFLAAAGVACEWLLRRYRPRLRWSLRTMLAAVGLMAMLCAWFTALRNRANVQDPIISTCEDRRHQGWHLYLERWGPKWLDLVGADRFRRRVVGADLNHYDDDDEEFLKRLGRLPSLRYLNLSVEQLTPGMAAAMADMRQLRTLRIDNARYEGDEAFSPECLAAVGKLARLEELHLGGPTDDRSLAYLGGLTNLKSLSLELAWELGEQDSDGSESKGVMLLLTHLPALPRLEAIDLRDSWSDQRDAMVGDQSVRHLVVLPRLKSLNVSDIRITDAGWAELASLKSLEELAIGGVLVTEEQLQSLLALKRLKALHIQRYTAVDEEALAALPSVESIEEREISGEGMSDWESELVFAYQCLKELQMVQYGIYDKSDRMTTVALDHGDKIYALESEAEGLRRALDALRQSHPGIVIDSDPKWFDRYRGQKRPKSPWES
ncbi:MAG TPA: hypothetical protein VND64_14405 [Pirellulales bacterium]|nr:hypothetical protein [Pirellulales bacterium]